MKHIQPMAQSWDPPKSSWAGDSDLAGIVVKPGALVLDAGCGSGELAAQLARLHPSAQIEGCDLSELAIKQAQKLGGPARFFRSSLEKIERSAGTYDVIVCRDVLSLIRDPRPTATELLRVLKPGGRIVAIEYDGLFCNLFPATPPLRQMLRELELGLETDVCFGRKLPGLLDATGFAEVEWNVSVEQENRRAEQRLAFALPAMVKALGGSKRAENFRRLYLEETQIPGAVVFYNKFVVRGRK